jgi:hypothetical protein
MSKSRSSVLSKSVDDLQNHLWGVLEGLKSKKMKPQEANAVTMAAKEICNSIRLEMQYKVLVEGRLNKGDIPLLEKK